jgi:hypothetical protein
MAQRPSERRAEQRIDVDVQGKLSFGSVSEDCSILNVCSNGFLLRAHEGLRVGQFATLEVYLSASQPVTCTVQIKHVNADRRGAMVVDMSEEDRKVYRSFIEEQRTLQMAARSRQRAP